MKVNQLQGLIASGAQRPCGFGMCVGAVETWELFFFLQTFPFPVFIFTLTHAGNLSKLFILQRRKLRSREVDDLPSC